MKKLLAVVVSCMSFACALTSCGDGGESSEVSLKPVTQEENAEESSEEVSEESAEYSLLEVEGVTEPETHEYIDADPTAFLGKWECVEYIENGENVEDVMGMPIYALFQYDVREGNTAYLPDSLVEALAEYDSDTTYSWGLVSENEIELVGSDGSVICFEMQEDGRLFYGESSWEVYLGKVDEFQEFDFSAFYSDMAEQQQRQQDSFVMTPVETDADGNIVSSGEPIIVEATTN